MGSLLKGIFWVAAVAGLLVGALRLTAIRWWVIPDDDGLLAASIMPTLEAGDLVILWRATAPSFGDLVVCPNPEDPSVAAIARIAGEEGDTVTIDGSNVFVNDQRAGTENMCDDFDVPHPVTGSLVEHRCTIEALGSVAHMRGAVADRKMVLPVKTRRTVTEGGVFLLSDNRSFPYDSRQYGSVQRETCKETVLFRLVSPRGYGDWERRFTYIR